MELEEIAIQLALLLKKYWFLLVLAVLGLIFFGYGLILLFVNKSQPQKEFSQSDSTGAVASKTPI